VRCAQAREALSAWYDGESADAGREEVEAHVATCAGCAAYRRGLGTIAGLAVPAAPPPGFFATLLADGRLHLGSRPGSRGRLGFTLLVALAVVVVIGILVIAATPASAHAVLESSSPEADSVVAKAPLAVDLTFDEPITLVPESVRVFGPDGGEVDNGVIGHAHGDPATASVELRPKLPDGTYLVSYRVVSADSHPVSGAFTFSVGHATGTPTRTAGEGGSHGVDVGLGIARWLGYAGSSLGLGGFAFIVWCWPSGWASRRARGVVVGGVATLVAGTLLALLLKGPYDEGSGLGSVTDGPLLRQVLATTYGEALDARLLLLAALVLLLTYRDHLPARLLAVAPALLLAGVGLTFALCGHAAAGGHRPVAVASDTVHVAAMSIWMGGLVMLLGALLVEADQDRATPPVLRFSTLATGAVTVLVATGTYQSLREVRSWDVLFHTHYGHVLVVKLVVVGVALLAAAGSRTWVWQTVHPVVPVLAATAGPTEPLVDGRPRLGRLRVSVALETVLLVVVLVVTAMLVTSDPARPSTPAGPVATTVAVGPDRVRVRVVPDGSRRVEVHLVVIDAAGRATEPKEIDASLTLTSDRIGPLPVTLERTGPGRRTGHVAVPVPGNWQLGITVRTSAIDEATKYVDVPIS
jgi:copper transport protein